MEYRRVHILTCLSPFFDFELIDLVLILAYEERNPNEKPINTKQ